MANEINGRDVYLVIDSQIFANEQGLTNSETTDTMETTSKHTTNGRKTYIAGDSTGTITANGFYCISDPAGTIGYHALKVHQKAGDILTYELGRFDGINEVEMGSCIITSINMNAALGSPATYDISLQKTGDYLDS